MRDSSGVGLATYLQQQLKTVFVLVLLFLRIEQSHRRCLHFMPSAPAAANAAALAR